MHLAGRPPASIVRDLAGALPSARDGNDAALAGWQVVDAAADGKPSVR